MADYAHWKPRFIASSHAIITLNCMRPSDLCTRALAHGLKSIANANGPLVPFTFVLDANPDLTQRTLALTRYADDYLEQSLRRAQDSITPNLNATMYAIVWDGFVTLDGRKWDALLAEVGEATSLTAAVYAQRYEPKTAGLIIKKRQNVAVGAPLHTGSTQSRLYCASS